MSPWSGASTYASLSRPASAHDCLPVAIATPNARAKYREAEVLARCPKCGTLRSVSARQARRGSPCRECSWGRKGEPETDFRLFWLDQLDDESLAAAACVIAGVPLRAEYVEAVARARWEIRLARCQ
jgi:hypothetical protein